MNGATNEALRKLFVRTLIGGMLVFASIRNYLLGGGLFIYRDWSWPLSDKLTPVTSFSPAIIRNSMPDPFGFSRIFLNWPVVIFQRLGSSPVVSEKLYVLYLFAIFVILANTFGQLLLRFLNEITHNISSFWTSEVFVGFVTVFSFANFWSLQQLSDLYYTYLIQFFLVSISTIVALLWKSKFRAALFSGSTISLCTFLAPEMYPFMLISVSLAFLVPAFLKTSLSRTVRAFANVFSMFVVTLPSVVTMLYLLSATVGTHIRPAIDYQTSSTNLSVDNAVRLLGYWWSLITYASPSSSSPNAVASLATVGSPPFMLVSFDPLTLLWLVASWSVPVFAFAAAGLRQFRTITIPSLVSALLGLLMTQPSFFPLPYVLAVETENTPLIGGVLADVFSIPDHVLIIVASAYFILVSTVFYSLIFSRRAGRLQSTNRLPITRLSPPLGRLRRRITHFALIAGISFLIVFPSWQIFSGSFYPSGYNDGGVGNGVPSSGSFDPASPPNDMIETYNWLLDQPGSFNIYWPGPAVTTAYPWSQKASPSITSADSPKPTFLNSILTPIGFNGALRFLTQSNLTSDIASYLEALNVRYLVVQPLSEAGMLMAWGVPNAAMLEQTLKGSPGISLVLTKGTISVFEVSGTWGSLYSPTVLAGYSPSDNEYSAAYTMFESIGSRIVIVKTGLSPNQLCFDNLHCSISILSPPYLSSVLRPAFDNQALKGSPMASQDYLLNHGQTSRLPSPWTSWVVANWGPADATVDVGQSSMLWTFNGMTLLSLSYNGTVTNDNPGGFVIPPGSIASTSVDFWYRTSNDFDSSLQVEVPVLDRNGQWFATRTSQEFPASENWREANFTVGLPTNGSSFTDRIQTMGSVGWVEIRRVDFKVGLLKQNQGSPFGQVTPIIGQNSIKFNVSEESVILQYAGVGHAYSAGQNFTLHESNRLSWFSLPRLINGSVEVKGNLTIGATMVIPADAMAKANETSQITSDGVSISSPGPIVFARMFAPGYSLTGVSGAYPAMPTLDGMAVFLGVNTGSYHVVFSSGTIIQVAYAGTLAVTSMVLLFCCGAFAKLPFLRVSPRNRKERSKTTSRC